jgi:hypothetical protein
MLQTNNLLLAGVLIATVYIWRRAGFCTPRALRIPARMPRLVLTYLGWTLIVGIVAYSIGGVIAGRTQVAKSGVRYAWREREPVRFWREIVSQTLVVAGTGTVLIILARKPVPRGALYEA